MKYINKRPIAILLAAYNAEKYLDDQIESLLAQTNQNWTLYIRNDSSEDITQKIIEKYCQKYPDKIIQIDKGGKNLGCRKNFFKLLEAVESEYYMFCDADDYWMPDKIELSFELMNEKEKIYSDIPLLVFGDNSVCDEHLNVIVPSWWKAQKINPKLFTNHFSIPVCNIVGGATAIFNNKAKKCCIPVPDNPPLHDVWISLQTTKYGKIFVIDKPLKLYRQHSANEIGAPIEPYRFEWKKISHIFHIIKRDYNLAKYFKKLGYGCTIKYFVARVVVFFKLQWSKISYR